MPLSELLKSSGRELKAELQLMLNAVVEGLCGLDAEGNVTFCNDALLRMTGYRTEEMIGNNLHQLLHPSRPEGMTYPTEECAFRNAMKAGEAIHRVGEFFWRKDGTCFPVEYWMHPLQQPSSLTEFVATVQDITAIQQAKDILRRSEEKFRRILAGVPDVVWTSDRQGRTIYISPKVESIFGYTKQEICAGGANFWLGRIHPEDSGRVEQAYGALFEKQTAFDQEYRIRRKDGAWIWVYDRATATHEENGVLYADGILCDITSRKQAEAELQSKTALLEAQTDSTIDGILIVDAHGRRILQNQRFVEMLQIPPEMVGNKDDRQMLEYVVTKIKDPESFLAKVLYLYDHPGETSRDEIELRDGTTLDRYSSPVVDKSGIYYGRIWTFRDITERKRNEDTLQQLSTAVEQSPVSVVITDPQGDISYVNRKFTESTGYGPEEVVGRNPRILNPGLSSPDVYRNLWSTIARGQEWQGEFCNKKKNGEIYWEAATISPITNAKGAITHFLAIKEDITESRRTQEALKASEKRYRLLFERNVAGILRTTLEGRVLECNQATARMFGYDSPEEILVLPAVHLYHQSSHRQAFLAKLRGEKSVTNQEMRCRRKNGDSVWVNANFSLIEDDASGGGIIEGILVDITERKRAGEALHRSETQYRLLFDNNPLPMWVFAAKTLKFLAVNEAAIRQYGFSRQEFLGMTIAEIRPEEDIPALLEVTEKRSHGLQGTEIWRHRKKDGTIMDVEIVSHYLDFHGIEAKLVSAHDVTERKRVEKELRLVQFAIEHASDAIFRIGAQGQIVYVNREACRSSGRSREELLALTIPEIDPLFPQEAWAAFWEEIKTRGSMTLETVHETKQGKFFPVEVTANYLELDGQESVFSFVRDISERNVLESQLRQAQKLEGIGQLAAGIAHEINTPTQFVTDNLTFLRDSWKATHELLERYRSAMRNAVGALPPGVTATLEEAERKCDLDFIVAEVPRAIEQSLDGTRRVARIIRAMKEFSHPDSAEKTATDLNRAVESTITVARNEWKYVADVATEFDETLPPVVCYPGDINQVILNLMVNAAHSIKEKITEGEMGRITVRTRRRNEFAEISVADTGMGIPEAIRTRIFDPFFTTKDVGKGTGQGLAIAHSMIVKKHHGKIWFETELGRGTTFFIDLPINPLNPAKEN